MFKADASPTANPSSPSDERITIPARAGQAPPEAMLGRAEFALVPRLVTAGIGLALAVSTWLRTGSGEQPDWATIGGALTLAAVAGVLAVAQRLPMAVRHRRTVWVYALGAVLALLAIAAAAIHDRGVGSAAFAAAMPLAVYLGLVFERRWRIHTISALIGTTIAVQVANPATPLLDTGVTLMLVLSAWTAGILSGLGHARTATVARRLSSFDQLTRSLNRRGLLVQLELAAALPPDRSDTPIAFLVIDVSAARTGDPANGDNDHSDSGDPDAAGEDDLLRWAGSTIPSALPATAELGRIARNEFGVLLPGAPRAQAQSVAEHVRRLLAERVPAVVGAATSETRRVAPADLLRVAEAATKAARGSDDGFCALVAGTALRVASTAAPTGAVRPERAEALSYAAIRPTGEIPKAQASGAVLNRLVAGAMFVVAICGVVIVTRTILGDNTTFYDQVIRYLGIPWVLWVIGIGVTSLRLRRTSSKAMRRSVLLHSQLTMTIGLAVAALSAGGITAAVGGALFIKVVFDSTILPPRRSALNTGAVLIGYAAVAALGPRDELWVVPFHLALFAGSYALGSAGYLAHEQIARRAQTLGRTDDLTGLPDRIGFRTGSEAAFFVAATETGTPFGVITLRLTDLRATNAAHGHAAGDEALRGVATALEETFPDAYVIGRTGSGEFGVCLPITGAQELRRVADELASTLRPFGAATTGYATCPEDGATVATLIAASEERRRDTVRPIRHAAAR